MNLAPVPRRFFVFLLVILTSAGCDRMRNDRRLEELEEKLAQLQHPPGTGSLARRSSIGVCGNGNHCDFFAGEIRSYKGRFAEVESFYAGNDGALTCSRVTDTANITYCAHNRLSEWGLKANGDSLYLVYYFINDEANGDLRCH